MSETPKDDPARNMTDEERAALEAAMGYPSRNMTETERAAHDEAMGLPDALRNAYPSHPA